MIRISPRHLVAMAGALVGLGAGPSHHAPVSDIQRRPAVHAAGTAVAGVSRDVSLIQYCGYWSQFDYVCERSSWPVDSAVTASDLAAFGAERGALREEPEAGDIFLVWTPRRRKFVHAGIVVVVLARGGHGSRAPYYDVETIEGDTDKYGHVGDGVAMRMTRRLSAAKGDRFLRWTALESLEPLNRPADEDASRSA